MSSENETVAEVLCEVRERCIDEQHSPSLWPYLDRIESAHNRELAAKDAEIARLRRHYQDMLKRIVQKDKGDRNG